MSFVKSIRIYVAMLAVAGMAFMLGLAGSGGNSATVDVHTVAGELTPGPYGSGVLGDWSTLSHGLYCFSPTAAKGSKLSQSYVKAAKTTQAKSSAAFLSTSCPNADIGVYGDSITFGAKSALAYEYNTRGYTLFVDAWSGRPTTPVADAICGTADADLPLIIIVASGTNDIFNPTVMAAQIKRILSCVPSTVKVFWEDVQATRWGQTDVIERNDQRNSMAVNLAIYQNMPVNRVIQWTQRFMANPGLLTTYLVDGVHPKTTPAYVDPDGITHSYSTSYAYYAAIQRGWLDTLGGI